MSAYFLDLESGSDAADGASFASRVKTWKRASDLVSAGDEVRVMGSVGPAALSVNATWVNHGSKVTLSAPVNADIDTGEEAWTPSANVTCAVSSTRKEGLGSSSIAVSSSFTTGLAARKTISPSADFSGYQQVSFWMQQTSGSLATAGQLSLKLCSDTNGATPVNTLSIPAVPALNVWVPVVIDNTAALGSGIQSVSLYVNSDLGAQTFLFDNIVAVQAAGSAGELHHKHLIGKLSSLGFGGDDSQMAYAIRSIRGTTIVLDTSYTAGGTPVLPVCGNTSETVTMYKFTPTYVSSTTSNNDNVAVWFGEPGNRITISGGWDRSSMSTQNGHTVCAFPHGNNSSINNWTGIAVDVSGISFARYEGSMQFILHESTGTIGFIGGQMPSVFGANSNFTVFANGAQNGFTLSGAGASFVTLCSAIGNLSGGAGATVVVSDGSFVNSVLIQTLPATITYDGTIYGGLTF